MDASEGIDGRRRVALALLGLRKADRKWLLAQLPGAERDGVVALLGELERMKLPGVRQEIAAVAGALTAEHAEPVFPLEPDEAQPLAPAEAPTHRSDDERRRALARLPVAAVHRALRDEPNAVIARVCALTDWPWASELSNRLGSARASSVARLRAEAGALPTAVADALLDALTSRVQACTSDDETGFAAELREAGATTPPPAGGLRWWKRRRT